MRTLPILDLSLLAGSADDAARFRDELRRATHEVGFFYLVVVPREVVNTR